MDTDLQFFHQRPVPDATVELKNQVCLSTPAARQIQYRLIMKIYSGRGTPSPPPEKENTHQYGHRFLKNILSGAN